LVTPSSQIVGAQALMNVLDGKRYNTLNKEFVDLVLGKYGKIPGKISAKLLKKVEKYRQNENVSYVSLKENRSKFSVFCKDNDIKDISKQDTHLLNFILFNKESKEFYQSKNKNTMNDIIGLQEGFGLYVE
jgi:pyruvate/oxaloacetate carboxyltransferase